MAPQATATKRRLKKGAAPIYGKVRIGDIPRYADPGAPHPFKKLILAETSTNTAENKVWHYQLDSWKVNNVRIADETEISAVVWEQLAAEEKKRGKGIALDEWVVMPPNHTIPHECVIQYLRRANDGPPLYDPKRYIQPKPMCESPTYEAGRFVSRTALHGFRAATTLRDKLIIPVTVVMKDRFSWDETKGYQFDKGAVNSYYTLNLFAGDRYEDALKVLKDIRKEWRRIPQRDVPEFEEYMESERYNPALVSKNKAQKKTKKHEKTKQGQIMVNTSLWDNLRAFEYVKGEVWVMPKLDNCTHMWNWNDSRRLAARDFISSANVTNKTPSLYIEIHFLPGPRREGANFLLGDHYDGNETSSSYEDENFDQYDDQAETEHNDDNETTNVNRHAQRPSSNKRSAPMHDDNETNEHDTPRTQPKADKRQSAAKRKGDISIANKPHKKGIARLVKPTGSRTSYPASSKKRKHDKEDAQGRSDDEGATSSEAAT